MSHKLKIQVILDYQSPSEFVLGCTYSVLKLRPVIVKKGLNVFHPTAFFWLHTLYLRIVFVKMVFTNV